MKMQWKILAIMVGTLAVIGCASDSGVVPLGENTFIISKQAATGFPGTGAIKTEALQEASTQCLSTGQHVEIIEIDESNPPYVFGNYPTVSVQFKCADNIEATDTEPIE